MNIKEIVRKYLLDNGFDGLVGHECSCQVKNKEFMDKCDFECRTGVGFGSHDECYAAKEYKLTQSDINAIKKLNRNLKSFIFETIKSESCQFSVGELILKRPNNTWKNTFGI